MPRRSYLRLMASRAVQHDPEIVPRRHARELPPTPPDQPQPIAAVSAATEPEPLPVSDGDHEREQPRPISPSPARVVQRKLAKLAPMPEAPAAAPVPVAIEHQPRAREHLAP